MNLIVRYMVAFLGNALKECREVMLFYSPLGILHPVQLEILNLFAFIFSSVDLI